MDENGTPPKNEGNRILSLIRKLLFDSSWDFLKAGVIAALFFAWGNVLGLLKEEPRSLPVHRNLMGDYFEGFAYLHLAFEQFRTDTNDRVPLIFEPSGLQDLRVCKDGVGFGSTPTGFKYMELLAAKLPQCIAFEVEERNGIDTAVFSVASAPEELSSIERGGEKRYFCGCDQMVMNEYLNYPDLYPDPEH